MTEKNESTQTETEEKQKEKPIQKITHTFQSYGDLCSFLEALKQGHVFLNVGGNIPVKAIGIINVNISDAVRAELLF